MTSQHNETYGVDVIIKDMKNNPQCEHGPTILFERFFAGKSSKFYACSACRNRKICSFYQRHDIKKQKSEKNVPKSKKTSKNIVRKNIFEVEDLSKCFFCISCVGVYAISEISNHSKCKKIRKLNETNIKFPTKMLTPKDNVKFEAQYLFTDKSTTQISQLIAGINAKKVLCIGCPRIYEFLKNEEKLSIECLLLDIDERFYSFYSSEEFLKYNLFNHHFFDGSEAFETYKSFLEGDTKLMVLMDPPFGGRIELIKNTLSLIEEEWQKVNKIKKSFKLSAMLVFPYFQEKRVQESLSSFNMLDYLVDYDNHPLYTTGPKAMKNGSAVRIFVNIPVKQFPLPKDEGYKLCEICDRWVYSNNKHCFKCRGCMSKDGNTYVHCDKCNKCVKPAWSHCTDCSSCLPTTHKCSDTRELSKCHICNADDHKRTNCPKRKKDVKSIQKRKKRKLN